MTEFASLHTWYAQDGEDTDVVTSTRVRLARNLRDFQFPRTLKPEDKNRVESIVFDAFSHIPDGTKYQSFHTGNIEPLGRQILVERGVLTNDMMNKLDTGAVVRDDGRVTCTVNRKDHLHLADVMTGFCPQKVYDECADIDRQLQDYLLFSGDLDTGYHTANLRDAGTGLKISVQLHLPSLTQAGLHEKLFRSLIDQGFDVYACYATSPLGNAKALGSWYRISTGSQWPLSETDLIAQVVQTTRNIIEIERKTRKDLENSMPTTIRDIVNRALATVKACRYVNLHEGIELVSSLKWAHDLGLVSGLKQTDFFVLLNRIQTAQLGFVIRTGNLEFEEDVVTEEQQIDRLRSLILQEAATSLKLTEDLDGREESI